MRKNIFMILVVSLALLGCSMKSKETPTPELTPTVFYTPTPKIICPLCFGLIPTPSTNPTPVVKLISKDGQSYLLIEDSRRQELVATETSRVSNCLGNSGVSQSFTRSRTFTSSVEIGVTTEAGIDEFIKLSVAAHYQLNLGVAETVETNVGFVAPVGLVTVYTVEWYEEWSEGRIVPVANLTNGEMIEIPYRAKKGLAYVVVPTPEGCLVTATAQPFPTEIPSLTPTSTAISTPTVTPSQAVDNTSTPETQ